MRVALTIGLCDAGGIFVFQANGGRFGCGQSDFEFDTLSWTRRAGHNLHFVSCLIIKLGATGDVVRTTPLITTLSGDITWVTAEKNAVLLKGLKKGVRCFSWEEREKALGIRYDLGINLEDTVDVAEFFRRVRCDKTFGACVNSDGSLGYTENSQALV